MIKIEYVETWGFKHAIRGMRNPMNSWDKSDSSGNALGWYVGPNDLDLMQRLYKAGPSHRKYLRQIFVSMDVVAPLYVWAEIDTYKIGVTRNSCSFMHRGTAKPFEITDFSIHDERVYEVLADIPKKEYQLIYPYETQEYKDYECANGRKYKVFRNGRVFAYPHEYTDTMGRHRVFEETECIPSKTRDGYYELRLGGRLGEKWMLHRLVAFVWIKNKNNLNTVNHINGDKGNNSVENLEWLDLSDNIKEGFKAGFFENGKSLHVRYIRWKNGHSVVSPFDKSMILAKHRCEGATCRQIAEEYGITIKQANNIISQHPSTEQELFELCYMWERIIDCLNQLRIAYLETKDEMMFQQIRCLLPSGYNQRSTLTMSYENAANIIEQRSGHKLDEWKVFTDTLRELPYMAEIMQG